MNKEDNDKILDLLSMLVDENKELQERINKAIEKYENCKEEDYCTLALDMYDILRGKDNE